MAILILLLPLCVVAQENRNIVSGQVELLEDARQALQNDDSESAMHAYEEFLQQNPDSVEALYQLAIIQLKMKSYAKGIALLRRAIVLEPENPLPRLALARILGDINQETEAIHEYNELLANVNVDSKQENTILMARNMLEFKLATREKDRQGLKLFGQRMLNSSVVNRKSLEIISLVYFRAGMFEDSRAAYEKLLELYPDNPNAEILLAGVYEKLLLPEKAIEHYDLAVKKANDSELARSAKVKASLLRAFIFLADDDRENAHKIFMNILTLDKDNVIANMNVAGYFHRANDLKKAREIYHRVTLIQPDNLDAHYRLAVVYLEMSDALNGVRELDYILAVAPESLVAQEARGTLAKMNQKWDLVSIREVLGQEAVMKRELDSSPDNASIMLDLGALMMSQQRPEEAKKYFEAAVAADNSYGDAYFKLGLFYEGERQLDEAKEAYQSALKLIEDTSVKNEIENRLVVVSANIYMKRKDFDKAEEKLQEANQRMPDDAKIFWGLAIVNTEQGDIEEAVRWYLKVIDLYPDHIQARMNLARSYERLEDEENAITHYNAISYSAKTSPELKKMASDRVDYLQRQINGVSYVVGYSVGVNDNLNSAREQKYFEYRSDIFAGLYYKYKLTKGMKFALSAAPSYSIYHRSQFDFFNFSVAPSLAIDKWGYDWSLGLNRNKQASVLRHEKSSTISDTLNASASWKDESDVGHRVSMSYRDFTSSQNAFLDSELFNLGIDLGRPGPENTYLSYGYGLGVNDNKNTLGNDYAYIGHNVNGRIDKRLSGRLSGYVSGSVTLNIYQNDDSSTNFQRSRRTFGFGAGVGMSYRLDSWVSVSGGYYYFTQNSNLPVGFIFNELQSVEGRQSASLGSFSSSSINTSIRMNF